MKRAGLVAALVAPVLAPVLVLLGAGPASALTAHRLAGTNQYETAVAVSQAMVTDPLGQSSRTAVITSGDDSSDVLVAPVVAREAAGDPGELNEWVPPVLLVPSDRGLPGVVEAELRRLQLTTVYIVGGTDTVSAGVESAVRSFVPTVERIAGGDRYGTAAAVSQRWSPTGSRVFVVNGEQPQEALAGMGTILGRGPTMLLTPAGSLPPATAEELRRLQPSEVVVVGGPSVVSDAVEASIRQAVPAAATARVGGADRYATNLALIAHYEEDGLVTVASGETWQNALVASALIQHERTETVLLLTKKECMPGATVDYVTALGSDVVVVGGPGNVSEASAHVTRC